jgi:transposase
VACSKNRTRLISETRAFCLEYGVAIRQGASVFKLDLPRILIDQGNDLSPAIRRLLADPFDDLHRLEERIAEVTRQIEALVSRDEVTRQLMTIPPIGPLGSSALIAAVGQERQFKKARDLSAWFGLVPRQHSTGGKPALLGIIKRGNGYVRRLLIHVLVPGITEQRNRV